MIRQPGFLPNIGFFKKIQSCDIFVYLDDAQFAIRAWDNRNKIKTKNGSSWITVPVIHPYEQKLNEVRISYSKNWQEEHVNLIKANYKQAPFFNEYWEKIEFILNKKWEKLIDLNLALIEYFNSVLSLKTKTIRASELEITSNGSKMLLDICKKVQADTYVSGKMGKEYLDESIFQKEGIKISFENFHHPMYKQLYGEFLSNMSIIDLLFNEGDNSRKILQMTKN